MGRNLYISVKSARDLPARADEEPAYGQTNPFVVVCFDGTASRQLGRTEESAESVEAPEWDHTFSVDVSAPIALIVSDTGEEPSNLSFVVFDRRLPPPVDADADGEPDVDVPDMPVPLGVASLPFAELVKNGRFEGELPLKGTDIPAYVSVAVDMKRVRIGSMLKEDAAVKIAGGVVGVAALGALGTYLYKRYEKKKDSAPVPEEGAEEGAEGAAPETVRTGIAYGANIDADDDDEEDRDNFKPWWEMDDEASDDDDDNRWTNIDE